MLRRDCLKLVRDNGRYKYLGLTRISISSEIAQSGDPKDVYPNIVWSDLLCATIFPQQNSAYVFTAEYPQSEWMKRKESNRVYTGLRQLRVSSLEYLQVV